MIQVLSCLKSLLQGNRRSSETLVFYLHYRATFLVLISFSILITTKQFVGEKISCLSAPTSEINVSLLESYCWSSSTYSVKSAYFKEAGYSVPFPGVGITNKNSEYTFRNYYQYIYIFLFIQALLFYFPHMVWKSIDKDRMNTFYDLLDTNNLKKNMEVGEKISEFDAAVAYIEDRWGSHKEYTLQYVMCEFLAFVNLLFQIYIVDVFLHGEFLGLGLFYSEHYSSGWFKDPIHLFPLVTSCYFKRYGAGGGVDVFDTLCVLPLNALNVKLFLFMWIWFIVLAILSFFSLLNLLCNIFAPAYRVVFLQTYAIIFRNGKNKTAYINLLKAGDFGDWFVLSSIQRNMESFNFTRLAEEIWGRMCHATHTIEQDE